MSMWASFLLATMGLIDCVLWFLSCRGNRGVYRKELPRVYELHDLIQNARPPDAYFRDFDRSLGEYPQKRKQFRDIQGDLQGLDPAAWAYLKSEAASLLAAKDARRGWQALFDILNQAKAYNYLQCLGCRNIAFIPMSRAKGQLTPDLKAELGSVKVLCEVKTTCRRWRRRAGKSAALGQAPIASRKVFSTS
jgi:hypothetical protein